MCIHFKFISLFIQNKPKKHVPQKHLGGATSAFSQNMFFTGTNSAMIPFSSEAVTMGVSNVQNAVRTPPTLWQYPSKYIYDYD